MYLFIFDGLILAREAEYVNIAYYPNRKTGKAVISTILTRYTARRGNSSLCMPFYLAESGEKK